MVPACLHHDSRVNCIVLKDVQLRTNIRATSLPVVLQPATLMKTALETGRMIE